MADSKKIRLGDEFRPELQLRSLYYLYLCVIMILGAAWYLPVMSYASPPVGAVIVFNIIIMVVIFAFAFALYWIPKYYETIKYELNRTEMTWRRGVWFRTTGIVPYNRITNIDISQGPVSRRLGISSLKIQTAGYSGQPYQSSEIRIDGVAEPEELRKMIMSFVRGSRPMATETYGKAEDSTVLSELVKIRKLLSRRK